MYNFLKQNKNVILMAVSLFVVSLTVLMFFLSNQVESQSDYSANIVHAGNGHDTSEQVNIYESQLGEHSGPMVAVGLDGSIDFVSEDLTEHYDLTEQEIKANLYFNYIHPEDLPGLVASVGQVFENEAPVAIIGPFRMKVKQPEYTVFIASLYPIMSEEKVINVAVLLRDITSEINLPDEQLEDAEDTKDTDEDAKEDQEEEVTLEEQIEKQTEFLELYNNFKQDIIEEIKTEETSISHELPLPADSEIMGTQEDKDQQEPLVEEQVIEVEDETVTESLALPPSIEEDVAPVVEKDKDKNEEEKKEEEKEIKYDKEKKDKKIRNEKDKESRLLVQNSAIDFEFLNPFWPFLSH